MSSFEQQPEASEAMAVAPSSSNSLTTVETDRLVTWLSEAMAWLSGVRDLETTLTSTARGAVEAIPGTECASVAELRSDGTLDSQVVTGDLAHTVDRLQGEAGEGPALDALEQKHTVFVDDIGAEHGRWPELAPRAESEGLVSAVCYRLEVGDKDRMALNLYAREPKVFDEEARLLGELFASHAGLAIAHARKADQLETALSTRDLIGQAKGILMERFGVSDYDAFGLLVETSQQTNLKLVKVASWLVRNVEREK